MKRWFVSGDVRLIGTEGPFLAKWEAVNAVSAEHAITGYMELLGPKYEIKKVYPPQLLGPATEENN